MLDLRGLFFRPTQSFEHLLPSFYMILMVLFFAVGLWMIITGFRWRQARKLAWKRFQVLARRFALSRMEIALLRKMALSSRIDVPSRLMTNENFFETIARNIETKGRRNERRLINSLRKKLFGRIIQIVSSMHTTHALPVGTRLFIRYVHDPENVVWGHLVDNDTQGLIVIIPPNRETASPLRVNTHLEIIAYVAEQEPLVFMTWVKSIIPGPRKMVIFGHSDFIVEKKGLNHRDAHLVGPQFQPDESDYESRPIHHAIRHSSSRLLHA